jgi:hypothetical protein
MLLLLQRDLVVLFISSILIYDKQQSDEYISPSTVSSLGLTIKHVSLLKS